jgi:apolipoprotein N-acyltransferase
MQDAVSTATRPGEESATALSARAGVEASTITDYGLAILSALLLVLSFPDIDLWPLAWVGLVPLMVVIARGPAPRRAFLCGWLVGTAFFYSSCYWLTYSMIHYGGISAWLAYTLLVPGALLVGLFPAAFALVLAQIIRRWGSRALIAAPFLWAALEWARLSITGQLWNAIGYSQAFHPALIQVARWGGVYAVGFLIVTVNASIALVFLKRTSQAAAIAGLVIVCAAAVVLMSNVGSRARTAASISDQVTAAVVALQPNVPMSPVNSAAEMEQLTNRHVVMSESALRELKTNDVPRLVVWPESPMNFAYTGDADFRNLVTRFARENHTAIIFNSQEPAPDNGFYNSALMVNEEGRLVAQYDKIRLMPFGEYVPLPHWLPGSNSVRAIVGDFTPGTKYTLMPLSNERAGVLICIESAYPWIARTFTAAGADVLINISNDGYLGPTAVMRQHLANVVFRAVENGRPLLRVTNTGISAYIEPSGEVKDATQSFQPAVRTWTITRSANSETFYTKRGDLFVAACAVVSLLTFGASFAKDNRTRSKSSRDRSNL